MIHIARDENAGAKVCGDLSNELNVTNIKYHQLDITSQESINKLRDHVMEKFGGLDVLINNSGVLIEVIKKLDDVHAQYFPCTDFLKTLTAGRKLDCEQSLFSSKIRGKERKTRKHESVTVSVT